MHVITRSTFRAACSCAAGVAWPAVPDGDGSCGHGLAQTAAAGKPRLG